jgi:putative ABC transport system permease protein
VLDLLIGTARSLRAHGLRFGLTATGILWGATMLTFLSATLEGINRHFTRELEEIGPKVVILWPGAVLKNRVGERGARRVEVDEDDIDRMDALESVESIAPDILLWSQLVRAGSRTKLLTVNGGNEKTQEIRNFAIAEGRFLTTTDVERRARVAFIGAEAAERLFGNAPALGRRIAIESVSFRVIGVSVAKGDQLMGVNGKDDLSVIIPHTTATRWLVRQDHFDQVIFAPRTREESFDAIRHTRQLLALHHDFAPGADTAISYLNFYEVLVDVYNILTGLRIFLVAAGVITLMVGAVGVMNIMLVVVGERTREIGLRKAVGASGRAVFLQFLAEATAICGASGAVGAALGIGFTQLVAALSPPEGPYASTPILVPATAALIVGALVLVGIVAGVVPAVRAARVPPAEALRSA